MTTALYRRYRPDTFQEVVGQEHVTEPLMAALRSDRVTHAYLFSGPRGCGKTTSARILARCLNCAEGPTDTPCGVCDSCVDLARGSSGSLDVVEIDAASHNGVDDARELRERASYAPVRDRYKIFILDEAHMVTPQGFNALLKLVEEPPDHVKFVFATTEPEKVIGTIRSRTHHYPFRLVGPRVLTPYLAELAEAEGVSVAEGVLPMVVRAGGGSVRDSLSVLDQLVAGASDGALALDRASALLGYTDSAMLDAVVEALIDQDGAALFSVVDDVVATGHDPRRFVEDLLERLRDLVVVAVAGEQAEAALRGVPLDQLARMQEHAGRLGAARLVRAADLTNAALSEMTGATSPRLHLELLCARILLPGVADAETGVLARVESLEQALASGGVPRPDAGPRPGVDGRPGAGQEPGGDTGRGDRTAAPAGGRPAQTAGAPDGSARQDGAAPSAAGHADSGHAGAGHHAAGLRAPDPAAVDDAGPQRGQAPAGAPAGPPAAGAGTATAAPDWRDMLSVPGRQPQSSAPAAGAPPERQTPPAARAPDGPVDEPPAEQDAPGRGAPVAQEESERSAPASASPSSSRTSSVPSSQAPDQTSSVPSSQAPAQTSSVPSSATPGVPSSRAPDQTSSVPSSQPSSPSAIDAGSVRGRWSEVVEVLAGLRRATWTLVSMNAVVGGVSDSEIRLDFPSPGLAEAFRNGGHSGPLEEALHRTFGVRLRATAAVVGAAPAPGAPQDSGARARQPRPARGPQESDPGDHRPNRAVPTSIPEPAEPPTERRPDPTATPAATPAATPVATPGATTAATPVATTAATPVVTTAVGPDGWPAVAVPGRPGTTAHRPTSADTPEDLSDLPGLDAPEDDPWSDGAGPRGGPVDAVDESSVVGPDHAPAEMPAPGEQPGGDEAQDRDGDDGASDDAPVVLPGQRPLGEALGEDERAPHARTPDGHAGAGRRATEDDHPGDGHPALRRPAVDPAHDEPSPDDVDAEDSGLMGVDLLVSVFGARVLEERSPDAGGTP